MKGLALGGVLVMLILVLAGGDNPPLLMSHSAEAPKKDNSPFSVDSIRSRLSPEGLARVQRYIDYYRANRRRGLQAGLARSTRYVLAFRKIFQKEGIPEELVYLPLIESGFIDKAVSPAQAVGVWQFIDATGRRYNLKPTAWDDPKRDPIKSARAAAKHLGHLFDEFKDWELALAAYNSGAGTVRWALRTNKKEGLPTNYWALDLPDETNNYVPAFLAAMLIAKNPTAYGFNRIKFLPEMTFENVKVDPGIALWEVAEQLGTDVDALLELNPSLLAGITPPGNRPYSLRVPDGVRRQVPDKLADLDGHHRDWVLYRVGSSDTMQRLANRFRSDASDIKKVNRLTSNADLRPGRFVIIPL